MARTFETIRNARMYVAPVGSTVAIEDMTDLGLISRAVLRHETDKKILMDTSDGTGGAFSTHYRVTTITGEVECKEEIAKALEIAFRATSTSVVGVDSTTTTYNALAASAPEFRVIFRVVNELNNNDVDEYECYRVKFSPAAEMELVSEDFASILLNFDVLTNPSSTSLADKFYTVRSTKEGGTGPVGP